MNQPSAARFLTLLGKGKANNFHAVSLTPDETCELVPALNDVLRRSPHWRSRWVAAYALNWSFDSRAVEPLIRSLLAADEHTLVRAQAAEALGDLLQFRRGAKHVAATSALRKILEGTRSRRLQFWTAFSLGKLRVRASLPRLRELARGNRSGSVDGMWSVAEEAEDAIARIEGRDVPDRALRPQKA